jgi:alkaline phosphatase
MLETDGTRSATAAGASRPAYDPATADARVGYDPGTGGAAPWPLDTLGSGTYLLRAATDSAAAATALATGAKTDNGKIAWKRGSSAAGALSTIFKLARSQWGMAIGVLTTVPFDHATPAAFTSHTVSRADYADIAAQILWTTRPDVVIGGAIPRGTRARRICRRPPSRPRRPTPAGS